MLHEIVTWEYAFLFITVVFAYYVKAITGFGNTLIMGSLFSFVVPNTVTTPVDLLIGSPANGYMVWRERRSISFKGAAPLALLTVAGAIPGVFFLKMGADWLLKALLGLIIIGLAIQIAAQRNGSRQKKSHPAVLAVVGLISGVLTGVFGIGALVAVYFNKTAENKSQCRSNMCFVFMIEGIFRFILYLATGILTKNIMIMAAALLPAVVIGMALGTKTDKYIDETKMRYIVIALLIVSGATLFVRNMFFH